MKEWKASEKEAQKMTRDGAISVNMVTGETSHVSDRAPEQDYSPSGDSAVFVHSAAERLDDRRIHKSEKKKRRKQRRSYREGTAANDRPSSRLQFTEEERAAPELQKAIRKSDKAADKLDAVRAAVPEKQPSLHQPVNPLARPLQEIGHAAHAKVHEVEQENVGVEAGHLTERGMEKAVRYGNRKLQNWQADRKLKPWREVSSAEQAAIQANADALYQKALRENPQLAASNLISRMWQKKKLQKQYAAAYRAAHSAGDAAAAAQTAAKGAKKSADAAKKTGEFVSKHKKAFLIVGGIGLLLVMLLGLLQSCSSVFGGGVSNIVASSYLSEDSDLLAAEAAYCAMEDELREYLGTYEQTHDYDEYHFDLDEIKHDPYVLLSILSALHEGQFTIDQVQGDLQMLFDKQYILTETVTTETRYRTEMRMDSEGNEYEVDVTYTYYICTVELENFNLSHVPVYIMDTETLSMYAVYMSTLGNRSDLFPSSGYVDKYITNPPEDYEIPAEYLSDERFAALITEAEKYLGYPYVWGGSSPSTSFDCSGFVSYVLTSSGLCNIGRLGAQGLYNISARVSDPQPGDLVFFVGTYDTAGISHVGFYVGLDEAGNPMFLHTSTSNWNFRKERKVSMVENKTLEHLPEVRAAVAALSPEEREVLAAVQASPFKLTAPEQFKEFADNTDYFVFEPNIHDLNDLGWRYLAQHMDMLLPPELLKAIDPVPFGKYAMQEEQGHFTEHGYISLSGDEWNHERPAEPEKKPSIRERLEQGKKECAEKNKAQPHKEKSAPEL